MEKHFKQHGTLGQKAMRIWSQVLTEWKLTQRLGINQSFQCIYLL